MKNEELYVVEFRNGLVKVGRSGSAWGRVASLSIGYGPPVRMASSGPLGKLVAAEERDLIFWAYGLALPWSGKEAFALLPFKQAVAMLCKVAGRTCETFEFNPTERMGTEGVTYRKTMGRRFCRLRPEWFKEKQK